MTKKKFLCVVKRVSGLCDTNDAESDTVDTAEGPDEAFHRKVLTKRKRHAKQVMSADREDALIDWIRETPCLYRKGMREYRYTQKISRLWADKTTEMKITGDFFLICNPSPYLCL